MSSIVYNTLTDEDDAPWHPRNPTRRASELTSWQHQSPAPSDDDSVIPMVILMLNRIRRVTAAQAKKVIATELGDDAAATIRDVGGTSAMSYLDWKLGETSYHLGTSSEPYINVFGIGKVNDERKVIAMKWTMKEEIPPEGEEFCDAWLSHEAWLYVDALPFNSSRDDAQRHLNNVFKVASHFIDDRCVLVWHYGKEPKEVVLPTPQNLESLRRGCWPG